MASPRQSHPMCLSTFLHKSPIPFCHSWYQVVSQSAAWRQMCPCALSRPLTICECIWTALTQTLSNGGRGTLWIPPRKHHGCHYRADCALIKSVMPKIQLNNSNWQWFLRFFKVVWSWVCILRFIIELHENNLKKIIHNHDLNYILLCIMFFKTFPSYLLYKTIGFVL